MSLQQQSVSAIYSLPATYSDPFFSYKQDIISYEDGIQLTNIHALSGAYDSSINNYTSHYLSNQTSIGEIFDITEKNIDLLTITTPLCFDSFNPLGPKFLQAKYDQATIDVTAPVVTKIPYEGFNNSIYFELEFIGKTYVRVKHRDAISNLYLNYVIPQDVFAFYRYESDLTEIDAVSGERNDMFQYQIDNNGYLILYKSNGVETRLVTNNDGILSTRSISNLNSIPRSDYLIKIDFDFNQASHKNSSSFISYIPCKLNQLVIDSSKSRYDLKNQFLFHLNYNNSLTSLDINYITLNNHRSEKGYIKNGANFLIDKGPYLDVDYREYMSLHTGNDQEKGNKNIELSYVFFSKDIKIKNGSETLFTAPSSLYPYEKININDTDFVTNGSFGGPSIRIADKIYVQRKYSEQPNDGRYLCTWLSAAPNTYGIWVDRYYDSTSKAVYPFYDIKSSLVIEPNLSYKYERIGSQNIQNIITSSAPLVSGFTSYYNTNNIELPYNSNAIQHQGSKYNKYSIQNEINRNGQFTISFEAYVDPEIDYGYQIIGNKTNYGFGVRNDKVITPFIYCYQNNILHIYNSDYTLLTRTKFKTEEIIKDVIINSPLDDFFVTCTNGTIYKLNAQGSKIKSENITLGIESDQDILGYVSYLQEPDKISFLKCDDCANIYGVEVYKNNLSAAAVSLSSLPYSLETPPGDLIRYNNSLFYIPGTNVKYEGPKSDIIYYTVNDVYLIKHNLQTSLQQIFVQTLSSNKIFDYNIDHNSNVYISTRNKISIYTTELQPVTSFALSTFSTSLTSASAINIDFIREYTTNGLKYSVSLLVADETSKLTFIKFDTDNIVNGILTNISVVDSGLSGTYNSYPYSRYKQTDFQYFNRYNNSTNINFEIKLFNYLNTEDILHDTIKLDLASIDAGYHTFTYRFDSVQGNISLFVDGVLVTNNTLPAGKYSIQDIFNDDIFVGTTGFFNGIDLATYLKQPGYYYIDNIPIKNLLIYDKAINDDVIYAAALLGKNIDDLVLSMPAGQRNNKEEIERIFKFTQDASSKLVDIYIKNLNITNNDFRRNIVNNIISQSRSLLPAGVNINSIKFVDYK